MSSIAENIAYGDGAPDSERVRAAAAAAEIDEFVEALPDGYDSLVGERGTRLSGGQRQRIALARASYRDTPIHMLEAGRIVESGTHERLLERDGIYASLWRLQTGEAP